MEISVVIPTLGRPDMLVETLASVLACDPAPAEVIVVDGDADRSAESVCADIDKHGVDLVYLPTGPGLTHQRNQGVARCRGEVVVFADDDVEFARDVFAHLGSAYRDPSVVGATGHVIESSGRRFGTKESPIRRWLPGGGTEGTFTRFGYPRRIMDVEREMDVEFMQGCFMSARRAAAESVGFDENLPGYGLAEDEDFSCRLARRGRIRYLPQARVVHKNTGFASQNQRRFGRTVVVNRTYLFRKNFRRTPLARAQFAMLVGLLVVHRLVNREWAGARGLLEGAAEAWRGRRWIP